MYITVRLAVRMFVFTYMKMLLVMIFDAFFIYHMSFFITLPTFFFFFGGGGGGFQWYRTY